MAEKDPDVSIRAIVKTVKRDLKEEKDPETKEVIGYRVETKLTIAALDLEADDVAMLSALQGDGELIVEISRRQRGLFKGGEKKSGAAAH